MSELHDWTQHLFELGGPHGTQPIQHYRCRRCKTVTTVLVVDGCTGHTEIKKEKWRSPTKEKRDVKKSDYPAKKTAKKSGGAYA